jgi:hypothetical protein
LPAGRAQTIMASDETQARIARNEALFREVNEGIERGLWPEQQSAPVAFRCECARLDCSEPVEIVVAEYERIRGNPRWFIVRNGHELPDFEIVVERTDRYAVVEKLGRTGETASILDRRS